MLIILLRWLQHYRCEEQIFAPSNPSIVSNHVFASLRFLLAETVAQGEEESRLID